MPEHIPAWLLPSLAACLVSTVATLLITGLLKRRAILDQPNERSLHTIPTPRGGGWAIVIGTAVGVLLLFPSRHAIGESAPLVGGAALLLLVSWLDDLKPMSPVPRFGAQIAAVALGLMRMHGPVFQAWLPLPLDIAATGVLWLWFINLFNFMDGMDGLAGGEALAVAFGLFLLMPGLPILMLIACATAGFLVWNWAPARIFMGDVGSIPLGYLLGAFLFHAAGQGDWIPALLLPLYFVADATITIVKRLLRGEKIWQAHRQHFYQQAVQAGRSHRSVATAVGIANVGLIAAALAVKPLDPLLGLGSGILVVALLLAWMRIKPA